VADPAQLASFTFLHGSHCFCTIEADIALLVVTPTGAVDGLLTFELELGEPLPTGPMDRERLTLRLAVNGQTYASDGHSGWFEDEMLDVQRKLPPGTFVKCRRITPPAAQRSVGTIFPITPRPAAIH